MSSKRRTTHVASPVTYNERAIITIITSSVLSFIGGLLIATFLILSSLPGGGSL